MFLVFLYSFQIMLFDEIKWLFVFAKYTALNIQHKATVYVSQWGNVNSIYSILTLNEKNLENVFLGHLGE